MSDRAGKMMANLIDAGGLFEFTPAESQLLIGVWRLLSRGKPVVPAQIRELVNGLGFDPDTADAFLRGKSERDGEDNIVGFLGLSLNSHHHGFVVGGVKASTWCAVDTLFLPAMLGQAGEVVSRSPVSGTEISLTVTPDGVSGLQPPEAVVSLRVIDPGKADVSCVEGTWDSFCNHIFFFANREEANKWAKDRDDIEVVSVDRAYEISTQMWAGVRRHA